MKLPKEIIKNLPGLCWDGLAAFETLALPEVFTAREAVAAYLTAGGKINDIARAYGALVATGAAPDTGAVWRIARLAFAVQPDKSGLRHWAKTLGPENWEEARDAAVRATESYAAVVRAAAADDDSEAKARAARAARAAAYAATEAALSALAAAKSAAESARAADYTADATNAAAAWAASDEVAAIQAQEAKILEVIFEAVGE